VYRITISKEAAEVNPATMVMTRRRAETRRRLVDAAYAVFAEMGIRDAPVEVICERAGFTRGAFYSNFGSKEELFLALYEVQMQERIGRLRAAVDEAVGSVDLKKRGAVARLAHTAGAAFVQSLAADQTWYLVHAEFRVQALRQPELRAPTAAAERRFYDALGRALTETLDRLGLRLAVEPRSAVTTIVALYEAAVVRALLEAPSPDEYLADALEVFATLIVPGEKESR
jgi:AcrR family transcriptional regulator